jgi:hypothetical protein
MYCSKCGQKIDDEAVTCPFCGVATKNFHAGQRQQQPMVFMNSGGGGGGGGASSSSSSSSAAAAGGYGGRTPYPIQSVGVHILLFLFTAGLGNIIYYFSVRSRQKQWHIMYG